MQDRETKATFPDRPAPRGLEFGDGFPFVKGKVILSWTISEHAAWKHSACRDGFAAVRAGDERFIVESVSESPPHVDIGKEISRDPIPVQPPVDGIGVPSRVDI